ncbi:ATP-binding protein [Faecalicatena sp. AGMB00832]|uniref:ATP-binding protein n=1 Tax=Faecalicatena faecalis TaxID=2726362 RepID=A0ABS6D0D9_9FIRM|nr:AAA family ATPase [Faecalicatena faecalis]MBU3874881.1 ATP-binding protein [Faecalicatena faecalis]
MRKAIPIGYEDFREMIEKDLYYVDKTLMIKELLDSAGKVNLITRPRRFGKTLNLSMLRYFFEAEKGTDGAPADNSFLFNGLKISTCGERYLSHQGKYPVINLSLKSAKQPDFDMAFQMLRRTIADEFRRHAFLLSKLTEGADCERFRLLMSGQGELADYADALAFLSRLLSEEYGRKTVILIDEYDVPLENAYFRGFYDTMSDFIRTLFESVLKTNPHLEFAVITGCLRISKESIFTGMNNLKIHSILSGGYSDSFGFTQEEVTEILSYYDLSRKQDEVRKWYDGYLFGDTEIYNPWSILNYVDAVVMKPDAFPEPYWSNTSSNSIIRELVERADLETRSEIERLVAGETIEKPVHEDITYGDIYESQDNLWNFLFFTGYLKKAGERREEEFTYLTLAIPNIEVRFIYRQTILKWFEKRVKQQDMTPLITAIENGDGNAFGDFVSEQLAESISFFDYAENYYHGFLVGLLKSSGRYEILSNRESGRSDIIMKEQKFRGRAVILELKSARDYSEMEELCHKALRQIEEKEYEAALRSEGYREVLKYGVCFFKKGCIALCGKRKGEDNGRLFE